MQVAARCHRLLLHTICRWRKTTREGTGTQSRRRPIEIVSLELFLARCGAAPAKAGVCWEGNLTCSEGLSSGGSRGLSTSLAGPGTHPQRPRRPSLPPPPGRSPCLAWSPWIGFVSEEGGGGRGATDHARLGWREISAAGAKMDQITKAPSMPRIILKWQAVSWRNYSLSFSLAPEAFSFSGTFPLFFFPSQQQAKPDSSRTS